MELKGHGAEMAGAPGRRIAPGNPLCFLAAGLLAIGFCTATLAADAVTNISLSLSDSNNADGVQAVRTQVVQECVGNVCSLPSAQAAAIPYPTITSVATIDATGGILRGHMRLEANLVEPIANDSTIITLRSRVGFMSQAVARLSPFPHASLPVLMEGSGTHHFLAVGAANCSSGECREQTIQATQKIILLHGNGEVSALDQQSSSFSAGREGEPRSAEQEFRTVANLQMPFEESFGLGWEFDAELQLDTHGRTGLHYIDMDFTGTLGFTGLRFYDVDGNDVTGGMVVEFDSPLMFVSLAPVPEPETYAMLLAGLGLLGFMARRRSFRK